MAGAGNQLFINAPFTLTQDTNVYGQHIDEGNNFDYILRINVASLCSGNMSLLFNNASFSQNTADLNDVNINIVLDDSLTYADWGTVFNNQNLVTLNVAQSNVAFSTLQPEELQTVGDRLLEIVAHKIFGHGQARAAISNDTQFYTHDDKLWDNLSNAVLNTTFRDEIFNQYVALGRYSTEANSNATTSPNNQNDVNNMNGGPSWVPFNFNGLTFDYPMFIAGNMLTDPSLTNEERNLIQNGPNVGGSLLANGVYNVPVLVKFHQ